MCWVGFLGSWLVFRFCLLVGWVGSVVFVWWLVVDVWGGEGGFLWSFGWCGLRMVILGFFFV